MTGIQLAGKTLIGDGGYSHVFAYAEDTVIELVKRQRVVEHAIADEGDHETILRAVWDAECTAYERLFEHPELARFAPHFYGRVAVSDVVASSGESLAASYLLDCAYRIQRVPVTDIRIGQLVDSPVYRELDAYLDELDSIGIGYTHDGSAFVPGIDSPFTIIDFATWDAMADLAMALITSGRLSDASRARWSRRATT